MVLNDVTDIDDHSHSESDWENEFTHEGRAGSESGAESGTYRFLKFSLKFVHTHTCWFTIVQTITVEFH